MKANAILLSTKDNVVTVVDGAKQGEEIRYFSNGELESLIARETIPPCHKAAIAPIESGGHVLKYGESIGAATRPIGVGEWVSHLNIESLQRDYSSELDEKREG